MDYGYGDIINEMEDHPRSDAGSPMMVNEREVDHGYGDIVDKMEDDVTEDHGYGAIIDEMEDDETEEHSGTGSISSVTGQINGVLAEYPRDVTTTVTEAIQNSVEYSWIDELDNESDANTSIVGVSQTQANNQLPAARVCETTTVPSWAQVVRNEKVSPIPHEPKSSRVSSKFYREHFPTLEKHLIPTTNVAHDKHNSQNNGSRIKGLIRERTCNEQITPAECNVGQLTNESSRKGKSASQQYMKNGKMCSGRPSAKLMDWVHPVTHNQRPSGEVQPPTIRSPSIQMIAVNGINSAGRNVWWEEVLLQVVEKGKKPYTLPAPPDDACVLIPSVNQTLLQKGINVDQVSLYRRECKGPAA